MNVLFVCRQNIGRSQVAKSLFNRFFSEDRAWSRGTKVEKNGMTLEQFGAKNTIRIMDEEGIDVRSNVSIQLNQDELDMYDVIILMSEPDNTPDWLENDLRSERWDIIDTKTTDYETSRQIYKDLERKIIDRFSTTS